MIYHNDKPDLVKLSGRLVFETSPKTSITINISQKEGVWIPQALMDSIVKQTREEEAVAKANGEIIPPPEPQQVSVVAQVTMERVGPRGEEKITSLNQIEEMRVVEHHHQDEPAEQNQAIEYIPPMENVEVYEQKEEVSTVQPPWTTQEIEHHNPENTYRGYAMQRPLMPG